MEELAELLLNMPQLQLCVVTLLRQPSENVVETTLLQVLFCLMAALCLTAQLLLLA